MPAGVSIDVRGLKEFRSATTKMANGKLRRLEKRALTDTARLYTQYKNLTLETDIDRPAPFTRGLYSFDSAKDDLRARAYVRPKQASYLGIVETGGGRVHAGKTGPMYVRKSAQDRYGGLGPNHAIERRFLSRSAQPIAYTIAGRRPIYATGAKVYFVGRLKLDGVMQYGLFVRQKVGARTAGKRSRAGKAKPDWRTQMLAVFEVKARYQPQLGFVRDARKYGPNIIQTQSQRALDIALGEAFTSKSTSAS